MCDQTCRRNGRRGKGGHRGRNPQRANGRTNREFESEHITNRARLDQFPAEPATKFDNVILYTGSVFVSAFRYNRITDLGYEVPVLLSRV